MSEPDPFIAFLSLRKEMIARKKKMLAVAMDLSRDPDERHACHVLAHQIGVALEQQPVRSHVKRKEQSK